jgi:threonine/homoserine/homoserine lactone efflux protein
MTITGLLIFASAYFLAVLSPGPGVAAFVARVLARGWRGLAGFIAGFVVGDLVWFGFAAAGMAALAQTYHAVFVAVKWAGVAYLLFLAWQMWTSASGIADPVSLQDTAAVKGHDQVRDGAHDETRDEGHGRLFWTSLSLTLGNPKPMVFFMALLPTIVDLRQLSTVGALEISALIVLIMAGTLLGYALLACRARRFITSPRHVRAVNRACSVALAGAAVAVARQ